MNKLILFIKQYKNLSRITAFSLIISLTYIFTNHLSEVFIYGEEIFSLINNLALALIANYIFCYNQVFLPDYKRKQKMSQKIVMELQEVIDLMGRPFEQIYKKKKGKNIRFYEISDADCETIFENFDLRQETGAFITHLNKCYKLTYDDEIYRDITKVCEKIKRMINYYSEYMDDNLLKILYDIESSNFCVRYTKIIHELFQDLTHKPNTNAYNGMLNNKEYFDLYKKLIQEQKAIQRYMKG